MKHADYLRHRLTCFASDPRCPTDFDLGLKAVISGISVSSSLTSRRYPIWPLVREHLDGVFEDCIRRYNSKLTTMLLAGIPLSEMTHRPPIYMPPPIIPGQSVDTYLNGKITQSCLVDVKPENMTEIDWQLLNLDYWDSNLRFVLRSLLRPAEVLLPKLDALLGTLESVRELFRLFRGFRPKLTKALWDLDALIDSRTRSQGTAHCELCWRESIRSKKLEEIDAKQRDAVRAVLGTSIVDEDGKDIMWVQACMPKVDRHFPLKITKIPSLEAAEINQLVERFKIERFFAGNLSDRYCSIHKPGSSKYHADLRYKSAFQHQLKVLMGMARSEFAVNFSPPDAADIQEVRKAAYDQVHSGLHAIAPSRGKVMGLREKVWLMRDEGLSQSEMARRLGVSRQAISRAKKSLEELLNNHFAGNRLNQITGEADVSARVLDEIRDGLRCGLPIAAIAKAVRLNKGTVDGLARLIGSS
ncbi:MarR family transcriptional regulator [Pseudomonas sp. GWSMS-1]|uniref:MarR family transcriptional regulator n=1 Tax=Pseudomonas sp. GWSMS-1 TaxID=3308997 RepID=UPI003CE6A999